LLFLTGLLFGCGYHFIPSATPSGSKIQSLAIPLVSSPSSEAGWEADFTAIIREEFIRHAQIPLRDTEEAQMVLNGKITSIETKPLSYDEQQQIVGGYTTSFRTTNRRRINLKMEVSLLDKSNGKTVWEDKTLEAKADFQVSNDPLATRYNQQQALQEIARQLARRIFQQTVERF
jgi:hypothetical protein